MYRAKDFQYMKVVNVKGKTLGYINDVLIDFHNNLVTGFSVSSLNLFKKSQQVLVENIVTVDKLMIATSFNKEAFIPFREIRDLEVYNSRGILMGVIEDIIIERKTYEIKGILISSGLIHKLIDGKSILIPRKCILGEDYMLFFETDSKIKLYSMPHKNDGGINCEN
ncbi:PRC-barrel domain-containing protein [Alloiococcus sp. CFN-8]|uniref:PRC-barrel domain-containing protein n=1 Tax=Alloiococcus sp. CFN-8 TaxID=3416081 RepID=UPI003CEBBBA5